MIKLKHLTVALISVSACAPVSKLPEVDSKLAKAEASKQMELAVGQIIKDGRRLHRVAYPILRHNWELCGELVRLGIELSLNNKHLFP